MDRLVRAALNRQQVKMEEKNGKENCIGRRVPHGDW